MAKKGKSDEKDQAEAGPLAGEPPVAEAGSASGVEAVVDGGGSTAAGAGGAEQPAGAETPVLGTADADMGEAAGAEHVDGAADAASEAGRPEAVSDAPADSAVSEGVSDAANVADEIDGVGSAGTDAVVVSQPDTGGCEPDGTGGTDDVFRDGDDVHAGAGLQPGCEAGEPYDEADRGSNDEDSKPLKEGELIPEPDIYQRARPVPGGDAIDGLDAGGLLAVDGSAVIRSDDIGHMLDAATRPGGYDGCRGFRLRGHNRINSIIDLNSTGPTTTSAMVFAHQDGWLVENVCIRGGYQSHYAEINSSRGVRFINCSFPDHAFTAGAGNFETLQIDYSNPVGYPENGPYDNTPCTDVMIIGCYFGPGQSGIGTHSTPAGDLHSNIHIIGCTFDAQAAYTIRAQGWMHSEIVGNIIRNSGNRGILSYDCKHIAIERNWIVGGCANDGATTGYAIAIGTNGGIDPVGVSVKGNRIIGVLAVGVYAASGTRHDVSDNYLEDSGEEAISIGSAVTRPTIAGNRIFGASVSVSGAKVAVRIAASSGKIHSNVIKRSDAANTYGYGIYFPTGAMRNTCDNNDVQTGINGAIGDQSAATSLNAINGRTLLFSGSATSGTITLADLITSFSALEVQTGAVGSGTFSSSRAVPFAAASGWVVATDHVTVKTMSGKVDCTIASATQLTVVTANDAVRAIYGLAA